MSLAGLLLTAIAANTVTSAVLLAAALRLRRTRHEVIEQRLAAELARAGALYGGRNPETHRLAIDSAVNGAKTLGLPKKRVAACLEREQARTKDEVEALREERGASEKSELAKMPAHPTLQ